MVSEGLSWFSQRWDHLSRLLVAADAWILPQDTPSGMVGLDAWYGIIISTEVMKPLADMVGPGGLFQNLFQRDNQSISGKLGAGIASTIRMLK